MLRGLATLLLVVGLSGTVRGVELPGEDGTEPAISPAPFPDRMSAYVWRNWGLVEPAVLAKTVGATVADLNAVAGQMGLRPDPKVLQEWRRKGYITILRRNWHLLPYEQLMDILGMTREQLYFSLMEDDFLWVKLGRVKPLCEPLKWNGGEEEKSSGARKRIAEVLKEEGLDPDAPEEPRFAFVKELASVIPESNNRAIEQSNNSSSPFDFRLIFSYFAEYGDPLGDPEIGSFPEGLLQKLSAQGVNAVWLHTVLRTLAKDPKYPEFGEGSERRIANLKTLVARAEKYGIRVFLYMNEPRAMPAAFFKENAERQALKGAVQGGQQAMCTACPETLRWLRDSLEQVFSQVPGLGGIFTITMSENLTNCASRGTEKTCPRCKDRKAGDLIVETNRAMIEGMLRGNPKAEAILYTWAWPTDEEEYIVRHLPKKGVRLMAVSENAMPICRGGVRTVEKDYSISVVGPGENAQRMWGFAKAVGIPAVAKVQAANSWELSSFPYIPVMDLVAQHAVNLAKEGVNGVMLSWSLGCCPSPNLAVYRDLAKGETTPDDVLDRMAARLYGAANVARVRRAWTAFSDGFANFPFSISTLYYGLQQWGPANPLYLQKTGWGASMVGIPYDALRSWRSEYPAETYIDLMDKVAAGFDEGCRILEGVAEKRELDMFRAEQMHFASCRDQARFILARDAGDRAGMRRFARAELERAKAYWPLVRADSRIGYESSNHYFFVPRDLLEKVLSCRQALEAARESAGSELQREIDAAAAKGGGRVTVGPGVHDCGTLWLKSGVELHLEKGAVLRGPSDWRAYDDVDDPRIGKRPEGSKKVFIAAFDAENVAITGEGTIDGRGLCFYDVNSASNGNFFAKPPHPRPRMLEFFRCKGVRLEGVELKDSPGWTCWLRECEDIVASRLRVHGDQRMINNDGLHVDGCRRVRIGESAFKTGDDCIIMRANVAEGKSLVCEDMVVSNCVLDSNCQCIRLSCPSDDLIRNGLFKNLKMSGSTGVLSYHPARYVVPWNEGCARMENIVVEDCEIDVKHHPVYFGVDPGVKLRSFGNTTFRNVRMRGGKPIVLQGTADAPLRNVRFENVTVDIANVTPIETAAVEGLEFKDCSIRSGKGERVPFVRPESSSWESQRW